MRSIARFPLWLDGVACYGGAGALESDSERVCQCRLGEDIGKIDAEVNDATDYAEALPEPDPSETLTHVYATQEERAQWR